MDNLKTITPKAQEIVAVFSFHINGICRAKIIGQNDDDSPKCVLVDFGLYESVMSKHIFALPSYALTKKVSKQVLKL